MSKASMRSLAKSILPELARTLLRNCLYYAQRTLRWVIILWQIRGATWSDQWILIRSALAAPFFSFKNLLEWQNPILLADAQVVVRGVGKFFLRARCDELYHVLPWRERFVVAAHKKSLGAGDTFVDAGANIGFYTILASRIVGETGNVVAVEMMPETASTLRRNLCLNNIKNVTVIERALSAEAEQEVIARVSEGHYGKASIAQNLHVGNFLEETVKSTTLSKVLDGITHIALMKMDLEGVEYEALQGAGYALSRITNIVFEQLEPEDTEGQAARHLKNIGFSILQIDGRNKIAVRNNEKNLNGENL